MEEMLWDRFTKTGRIEDYLSYAVYRDTDDNDRRNSPERALCG